MESSALVEVFTYVGTEAGEPGYGDEPSGDVVSVAEVCLGAGPGGGDYRHFSLTFEPSTRLYTLWDAMIDGDISDKPMYFKVADGLGTVETSPRSAALQLLREGWVAEANHFGLDLSSLSVLAEGLLATTDLMSLRDALARDLETEA